MIQLMANTFLELGQPGAASSSVKMEDDRGFWRNLSIITLFFFLSLWALTTQALTTDKEQTMHIVADSADISQKKHKGVYTGNVEFMQGTTNIHAARAVTEADTANQLKLAIALGTKDAQAHYWTQTDPNKPPFHAWANKIYYYPLRHLIELIGNARVEQGDNSLSADKISYDTLEQHVITQGNKSQRIKIILHPEQKPS